MLAKRLANFFCRVDANLGNKVRDSTEKRGRLRQAGETGDLFFITYLYICMLYGMALLAVCNMYIYQCGCRLQIGMGATFFSHGHSSAKDFVPFSLLILCILLGQSGYKHRPSKNLAIKIRNNTNVDICFDFNLLKVPDGR